MNCIERWKYQLERSLIRQCVQGQFWCSKCQKSHAHFLYVFHSVRLSFINRQLTKSMKKKHWHYTNCLYILTLPDEFCTNLWSCWIKNFGWLLAIAYTSSCLIIQICRKRHRQTRKCCDCKHVYSKLVSWISMRISIFWVHFVVCFCLHHPTTEWVWQLWCSTMFTRNFTLR